MIEIIIKEVRGKAVKRFLSNFIKKSKEDCWEWDGRSNKGGYGRIAFNSNNHSNRHEVAAHRFSFAYYNGVVPKDKVVMHMCDNPKCVNPNHLKLGTYADNEQDKIRKGRKPRPKLIKHSLENAKKVFDLVLQDKMYSEICEELSLPGSVVTRIYSGIRHENNNYNDVFKTYSKEDQDIIKYKVVRRGERIPTAKLKEKDVKEIRLRHKFGETEDDIKKDYPVGVDQIKNIVRRKHWKHVLDPSCYRQSVCDIYGHLFSCPTECNGYIY